MSESANTRICACGTTIPPGTDFEPGCRHCSNLKLNRQIMELEPDDADADDGSRDPSVDIYYGVASGQQRSALTRMEPEAVMISHATSSNKPIEGDHSFFLDCGGYHHMKTGDGEYSETLEEYAEYIREHEPDYWALRDYPCESDLLDKLDRSVSEQQERTTEAHSKLLEMAEAQQIPGEPVPVLQGWTESQYLAQLDTYLSRGIISAAGESQTVAIGSVCRRNQDEEIAQIILSVRDALPAQHRIHAFGVKGPILRFKEVCQALDSVDSAAYDWEVSRRPDQRFDGESFTWRDCARAYYNWRYELMSKMATESLEEAQNRQAAFEEFDK